MPTRDSAWPAGTPNWVDCTVEHPRRALDFYGKLFGWDVHTHPTSSDDYTVATKHGRPVAGIAARMQPDLPSAWCTYFASDDVDATSERVRAAGGTVLVAPADVPGAGRMAFFADPEGAVFGAWQGREHAGFGLFNEPGSVGWNDLMTRDLEAAKRFYAAVFDFTYEQMGPDYVTVRRPGDGDVVAGLHLATQLPEEQTACWLTHVVVADRDSTVAIVEELDGEVLMSFDTPFGPEATIRGPEGEVLNVIAFTPQAEEEAEHDPDAEGE